MSRKTITLFLVLLLFTSSIPYTALAEHDEELENGFTELDYARLWSGDPDTGGDLLDWEIGGETVSEADTLRTQLDYVWDFPPETPTKWNTKDVKDFPGSDIETSVYPKYASPKDRKFIKDAYIEVASVSPSTRIHRTDSSTSLLVPSSGTIVGTTDYRVETKDLNLDSDVTDVTIENAETQKIVVKQGNRVVGKTNDEGAYKVEYSDLKKNHGDLVVEATIRVTVTKTYDEKVKHKSGKESENNEGVRNQLQELIDEISNLFDGESMPSNDSNGSDVSHINIGYSHPKDTNEGNRSESHGTYTRTVTKTIVVSDTVDVTVHKMNANVEYAKMPDGEMEIAVTGKNVWTGLILPSGTPVNNRWSFYTQRKDTWSTLVESNGDTKETYDSEIEPVQTHAFPYNVSVLVTEEQKTPDGTYVRFTKSANEYQTPTLPTNVKADVYGKDTYTVPYRMVVHYPEWTPGKTTVVGAVNGVKTKLEDEDPTKVHAVSIQSSLENINTEKNTATLRIKVTGQQSGDPVVTADPTKQDVTDTESDRTKYKLRYLVVDGERLETNKNGVATTRINYEEQETVTVKYHSMGWWRADSATAYESKTRYVSTSGFDLWVQVIDDKIQLFVSISVPLIILGELLRRIFGFNPVIRYAKEAWDILTP